MEENNKEIEQNDKTKDDAVWRTKARMAIYPMAGIYLIYQAHNVFKEISVTSGNEQMLMILFTIVFTVLGLGLVIFGLAGGYKYSKKMHEQQDQLK